MLERGLEVDHSTINRWVLHYGPELDDRTRPYIKPTNDSWKVDETYIKVRKKWMYLYRAIDSDGNTLDFLLTARRNAPAAERFLRKVLLNDYTQDPRVINVDKNPAYPKAIEKLQKDEDLPERSKLRAVKYLNNLIEQDHRFIKRLTKAGMGFGSFYTARRTLKGFESMNMIRKGQVKGVEKRDVMGQISFINNIFGVAA